MMMQIHAVYEDGVLKPLGRINIPEHKELDVIVISDEEGRIEELAASQKKAIQDLIGVGESGQADISVKHDDYIYSKD